MSFMLLAKTMTGSLQRAPQTAKRNKYKAVFFYLHCKPLDHTNATHDPAFLKVYV